MRATNHPFTEQQRFRQTWIWVLLAGLNAFFIYGLVSQVFFGEAFGSKAISNEGLAIAVGGVAMATILMFVMRLDTIIDKDGIHYRFFPFQWTYKTISWERISEAYVREYNPITEYGGWGIRIGLFGSGQAFNVSGDQGLQLVYDNGKKFLIGTQRPEEIARVLGEMGRGEI